MFEGTAVHSQYPQVVTGDSVHQTNYSLPAAHSSQLLRVCFGWKCLSLIASSPDVHWIYPLQNNFLQHWAQHHSTVSLDWLLVLEFKLGVRCTDTPKANLYPRVLKRERLPKLKLSNMQQGGGSGHRSCNVAFCSSAIATTNWTCS